MTPRELIRSTALLILCLTTTTSFSAPNQYTSCADAFEHPPFADLQLVDHHDMNVLSELLKPLVGLTCTLDELQGFFVGKGASINQITNETISLEVSGFTKFLRDGGLWLPTSVIAAVKGGKITFIDANVSYF
jgi:hypothetical protein